MHAATWPGLGARPRLAASVAAARAALLADAAGRVLDVDAAGTAGGVGTTRAGGGGAGGGRAGDGPPYDAVLSVLHLARVDDPEAELRRLRGLLRPEGRLLVLEPNRRPGWRGALADVVAPAVRLRYGLRVDVAVPPLVRAAGFTIIDVERMTMPTLVVPLRSFVRLVAVPSVDAMVGDRSAAVDGAAAASGAGR